MSHSWLRVGILGFSIFLGAGINPIQTAAQTTAPAVVPDASLGTIVTPTNTNFTITGGTVNGPNLFHSFQEFSIPTNGSATFDLTNTPNLSTIFSRVTGGSISNIDGTIQALNNGQPVSLFLLNPNGIILGSKAQLNIGGSFLASTATNIQFADGKRFNASAPTPILSISVPIGLQIEPTSGSITLQGTGSGEFLPSQNLGLVGSPGATLALLGNGVNVSGGVVTVPVGRLEVGSVAAGEVALQPTPIGTWQFNYDRVQNFADVNLRDQSWLWTPYPAANPFGGIQVAGRNILLDRSQITTATLGAQTGGDIQIRAQETLSLTGTVPNAAFPSSRISTQVLPGATGTGGQIQIQAGQVIANNGAAIETFTFGAGTSGAITVNADRLQFEDSIPYFSPILGGETDTNSGLLAKTFASGNTGDIRANARQIEMKGGARIASIVFPSATGNGGDLWVRSDEITATGVLDDAASGIQALATGFGRGGDVQIDTRRLTLLEGAIAMTFAYRIRGIENSGFGNAGDIRVTARERIDLASASPDGRVQAFLGSITTGSGNSGNVTVQTPVLSIREGASLTSGTAAVISVFGDPSQSNRLGNSGNLNIAVGDLEITGINPKINNGSSLGTFSFGNGDAGSAFITADRIRIQDGANILASTLSTGNSGELRITAKEISISGQRGGRDAAILTSADQFDPAARAAFGLPDTPTGRTAQLSITADKIQLDDRGKISTTHAGLGDASNLQIIANRLSLNKQASITANTRSGNGGNIDLRITDLLTLRNNSQISAESQGIGNGGNMSINTKLIAAQNNSDIFANAITGNGGNINLTSQGLIGIEPRSQLTEKSDITASSRFGLSGQIQVNTLQIDPNSALLSLPESPIDESQSIAQSCRSNFSSSFTITGRGGVETNPILHVPNQRTWGDLRSLDNTSTNTSTMASTMTVASREQAIQQATSWRQDLKTGTIHLIADGSEISPQPSNSTCASGTGLMN